MKVESLLTSFESQEPEIVFEWNDQETDAVGWVVINSLRGGAAGGGTRMRAGLDKSEVIALAKTMEIKFSVAGPAIGGAKAGINFDPADPRKKEVLERWYKAVMPLLKNYWGTGGDLNVDEIHEVIPITEAHGLPHPQAGIVQGHFKVGKEEKLRRVKQLRQGVSKVIDTASYSPSLERKFVVADMATGFGLAEAARLFLANNSETLKDKRVIVQGWGNVASGSAFFLTQHGAKIVGIIDRKNGLIHEAGFSHAEVKELILQRNGNALGERGDLLMAEEMNRRIWDTNCDIFIPAAASRLVTQEQAEKLVAAGCKLIVCGANVPFADKEIFFGPTARYLDQKLSLIPDFVANCGMARVFAYLMHEDVQMSDAGIFMDISETIRKALEEVKAMNAGKLGVTAGCYEVAIEKLMGLAA